MYFPSPSAGADIATHAADPVAHATVTEHVIFRAAPMTFTNLGAGPTEISATVRAVVELSAAQEIRLVVHQSVSGGGTGDLKLEYSTDDSTWADLTTTAIDLSTAAGAKATAWEAPPAGAQGGLKIVRVVGVGGNGTEDHTFKSIALQVR